MKIEIEKLAPYNKSEALHEYANQQLDLKDRHRLDI